MLTSIDITAAIVNVRTTSMMNDIWELELIIIIAFHGREGFHEELELVDGCVNHHCQTVCLKEVHTEDVHIMELSRFPIRRSQR